jgi:hypothetical protein
MTGWEWLWLRWGLGWLVLLSRNAETGHGQ